MTAKNIICKGLDFLGTPYEFNADPGQTKTFDCSSFIQYLYGSFGIQLPRNTRQQYKIGRAVRYEELKKGDLLFFTTRKRKNRQGIAKIGHVAIYIGNGLMLHTRRNGSGVTVEKINNYWKYTLVGARRVIRQH